MAEQISVEGRRKDTKARAGYMGPENGPFRCGRCRYFDADAHRCVKVEGPISANGCCNYFKPERGK